VPYSRHGLGINAPATRISPAAHRIFINTKCSFAAAGSSEDTVTRIPNLSPKLKTNDPCSAQWVWQGSLAWDFGLGPGDVALPAWRSEVNFGFQTYIFITPGPNEPLGSNFESGLWHPLHVVLARRRKSTAKSWRTAPDHPEPCITWEYWLADRQLQRAAGLKLDQAVRINLTSQSHNIGAITLPSKDNSTMEAMLSASHPDQLRLRGPAHFNLGNCPEKARANLTRRRLRSPSHSLMPDPCSNGEIPPPPCSPHLGNVLPFPLPFPSGITSR